MGLLKQYTLAEKNGKTVAKIGRDILFIEKCLNFLRPGGRMAIILPQGRLNNSSDLPIRNFILDKARLLAVVGLDVNTFKPHTGTKTSVLFLQKYTDDELANINNILNVSQAS
jgi:type I restriction enzyme M protein